MFLWARQDLKPRLKGTWNGIPGHNWGTGSTGSCSGLESAAAGGLERAVDDGGLEGAAHNGLKALAVIQCQITTG